ncbi:MAG: TPM domain-containing protein [Burkholderiales bacterium]|nr:MAG: TPM domain-containing protein [Burkholderiales bacterium]
MQLARWIRHRLRAPRAVDRALPRAALDRIEKTIAAGELRHRGEIRLAVESSLPWSYLKRDAPVRERADMMFAKLRVWDTDERNGVLIYVELADHGIEIVADRGVARAVPPDAWPPIVAAMAERFRAADFEGGVVAGIEQIGRLLAQHFPAREGERNADELPNRPVILGR